MLDGAQVWHRPASSSLRLSDGSKREFKQNDGSTNESEWSMSGASLNRLRNLGTDKHGEQTIPEQIKA